MIFEFGGKIFYWRGPSPYYYIAMPEEESLNLKAISGFVSYGWGCIPVHVRIGKTEWKTSLFPKNGRYLVPIKDKVREVENLDIDDEVRVWLKVGR